jgi:hypothetical protein
MKLFEFVRNLLEARPSGYHKKGASYAAQKAAQLDLTSHGNSIFYDRAGKPVARSVNGGEDLVQIGGPDKIQNPATKPKQPHPQVAPFTVKPPAGEEPMQDPTEPADGTAPERAKANGKRPAKPQAKADTSKGVQIGDPKEWKDMPPEEVVHNLYHMTGGSDLASAWVDQKLKSASNKGEQDRLKSWKAALDQIDTSQWPPSNKWHDMAKTVLFKSGGDVAKARNWMSKTLQDYKTMKTKTTPDKAKKIDGILRFSRALKALDSLEAGQADRMPVSFHNDPWYSLRYGADRPDDIQHDTDVANQAGRPVPKAAGTKQDDYKEDDVDARPAPDDEDRGGDDGYGRDDDRDYRDD